MKIPSKPYRCPLGDLQATVTDLDALKRDGWRKQRLLVVSADDESLDFVEREIVRRLGDRLYGKNIK